MEQGKLSRSQLCRAVLRHVLPPTQKEVIQGSRYGADCAVLRTQEDLVLTTDPITGSSSHVGRLAVHVSANDVAAAGAVPKAILLTVIAPLSATLDEIEAVMQDAQEACRLLSVDIIGGHTEFSDSVNRLIVSATMVGTADQMAFSGQPKKGDTLVATKHLGLEGTAILAADHRELDLTEDQRVQALRCFDDLSVVREGRLAAQFGVNAMHDVTEGGILGATEELCARLKLGCHLWEEVLPYLPVTRVLCDRLNLDPHRLIGSGSMLIVTDRPNELIAQLKQNDILATAIGVFNDTGAVTLSRQL